MRYAREYWATAPAEVAVAHSQAQWLLGAVHNIVVGTVNRNGTPHTTVVGRNFHIETVGTHGAEPVMSALFWSFPDTRHVRNIVEHPERMVRLQLFRSEDNFGALALHGFGTRLSLEEVEATLPEFNARRAALQNMTPPPRLLPEFTDLDYPKDLLRVDCYEAELPVRAYDPEGVWAGDIALVIGIGELLAPEPPTSGSVRAL